MHKAWMLGMLLSLSAALPARAEQPVAKIEDAATERARRLHQEGDALYERGAYAEAYAAYLAAWSLKRHYQIAGNLGDCEMKLGKYRDAAAHLAMFIQSYPKDRPPSVLAKAKALHKEALGHVGELRAAEARAGEAPRVTVRMQVREEAAGRPVSMAAPSKWPGVVAGTGLALSAAVSGVGFELAAEQRYANLNGVRDAGSRSEIADQVDVYRRLSVGAFAVGGAAALSTLIYALWPQGKPEPLRVEASFLPGSAGLGLWGRF